MKPTQPIRVAEIILAVLCLSWSSLVAQVIPESPGDIAVFSNFGGAPVNVAPGTPVDNEFLYDELTASDLAAPTTDLILNAGKYVVLYNCRVNSAGGSNRAELRGHLSLEPAGGGEPVDLAYGWSQGYIRIAEGANSAILSGATIIEAANAGDILRLHTTRTDVNAPRLTNIVAGDTAIQLLRLEDSWDYLRLGLSGSVPAAVNATFTDVTYDIVDEASTGAMSFEEGSGDIVFNEAGRYLVFVNTAFLKPAGNGTRTGYTQQLTLDGTPIVGSRTTTYLRGNPNAEQANNGVTAIGIIVEAAAGQVLNVEQMKETGQNSSLDPGGTGLAIVQLPSFGQFISLTDTSGQDINPPSRTPMNFAIAEGISGADFTHIPGGSEVTVNKDGAYLFLGAFFTDDDGLAVNGDSGAQRRQIPHQRWSVGGTDLFYGQSGRYSRDLGANNNGNWSGILANLSGADTVEMTMGRAGADGTSSGDSMGLQAVRIGSLFPSNDPEIAVNVSYPIVQGTSSVISTSFLEATDADTPRASLIFTVDSLPAAASGTLRLDGAALAVNDTFTQVDLDDGLLSFEASALLGSVSFGLSVSDGNASDSASFTIIVGQTTEATADAGTTNEDTQLSVLDGGADTVLDNDSGTGLSVAGFDSQSALGATVNVEGDGTFTYDSRGSAALQALAEGEQAVDTFSYTLLDFQNNTQQVVVSITVNGVNDAPEVGNDSANIAAGVPADLDLFDNDSDTDVTDVLRVVGFEDVFGNGGAIPDEQLNFQSIPFVFTSNAGATVSIGSDGRLLYDPSTSAVLLNLAPGVSISEVFTYEVSDGISTLEGTVTITTAGGSLPTKDYAETDADSTVNITVLDNDLVRNNPGNLGTPTAGAVLEFVADRPGNTNTMWSNTGSASLGAIPDTGNGDATLNADPVNPPPGVTAVYNFAGTQGIPMNDIEQAAYGDLDTSNYSVEIVFRPTDQLGNEVIWEVGGATDGSSVVILDNRVAFTVGDNGNLIAQAVAEMPPGVGAGGDWVQVVGIVDLGTDTVQLWINGQLAATGTGVNVNTGAPGNLADNCGTDNGGIGRRQTDVGGDVGNLGAFGTTDFGTTTDLAGEVAIFRMYRNPLTATQIQDNFDAVFGAATPATTSDLTALADGDATVGVARTLPSGATVTLRADGTIDYDPNGAFDHVGEGLMARDSFTYGVDTGVGATVTVNVVVAGTNTDPQVTISGNQEAVSEGSPAIFTVSASAAVSGPVNVAVSFSGLAEHTVDFNGLTMVQIPDGQDSRTLVLPTVNDSLFEGLENVVVSIESVTGNAVLGATLAAEILLDDTSSAPEFTIAADQATVAEGTAASFTITPTVPSQAERTLTFSYSGTAENGVDFLGQDVLVIPGGSATGTLAVVPFDDNSVEGTEVLTVTLESVDTGTIGATSSASTNVTDGSAQQLFFADFEGIDPLGDPGTPGGTTVGFDAPVAAELGTTIGSWEGIPTSSLSGDLPGVYLEIDDAKGDGNDEALVLDRPPVGEGDITARLAAPADLTGSSTALITMDLGNRRTQNNTEDKSWRIIGLDDSGEKSFELFVSGNNNAPHNEQLHHVDADGVLTPLGNRADFDNTGSIEEETEQSTLLLSLTADGYQVGIDRWPIDGVLDVITGTLEYAGPATQISGILFRLSADADVARSSGIIVDDLKVSGIAGNVAPSATLDGTPLAAGGSMTLPDSSIGTNVLLDGFQVDDADAGTGTVTATFESGGAAPLTFSGSGPATVGGNGSGTLTLSGTLDDVNASLAGGVTAATNAVTGGAASIVFTIDDGGNTGPGGVKSLSYSLDFFVNEGPTVTIDYAPGQQSVTGDSPIEFQVIFSDPVTGFTGSDVDFSASTETGPLVATVSGAGDSYIVAVTGMSSGGEVIISIPKGAASAVAGGALTEASKAVNDRVVYVPLLPPSATNLNQNILYEFGPVDLDDIVVSDPNDSVVTSPQAPQYDHPVVHGDSLNLTPDPAMDAGFAIEVALQPSGFDDFGTVRVIEIGGTSNGTGIYLFDGVPHLVSKMNSTPNDLPMGGDDTDWTDGNISIPLSSQPLPLDEAARIAVVSSLDQVTFSVNGMGQSSVVLTGRVPSAQNNWSGDDTIRVGQNPDGGNGGLGTDPAGLFDDGSTFPMEGTVSQARLWHAADASGLNILAVDEPEEITVSLSLTPGEGELTEVGGATFNGVTGVWSITGSLSEVNAALAGVQFQPDGVSPVTIDVEIDDADEDGGGPLTGTIILRTASGDADGDGLPDDYENANGLNPNDAGDARTDGDGDGWDALSEYLMGTAAGDRNDSPFFEVNHVSATEVVVTYGPIFSGRTYDVLSSTDGENFSLVESVTAAANSATLSSTDATGNEAGEIYKLEVTVSGP